ncbi:MAG: DUF370 domain-containing protein [Chloroflexia bacterium]|nr:DUF370 domain-containing protein [Chloroflexia bacterium]
MRTELLHIGFGNVVAVNRLLAIVSPDSLPIRRMIREAREQGTLVDASRGRKVKSALVMDNGYIVVAALNPSTLVGRLEQQMDESGGPADD